MGAAFGAAADLALLALGALLLAEAAARMGAGVASLLPRVPGGAPARTGAAVLLGWSAWGLALLGAAAVGLYRPFPVLLSGAALLAGSRPARYRGSMLRDALAALPVSAAAALAAVLAVLAPRLPWIVPATDTLWYELGAPAQYLAAGRILLDGVANPFHLPAPVNMDFGVALALGDARLATGIVWSHFVAASLVLAGLASAAGSPSAGWIGLLFAASLAPVAFGLSVLKSDLPAGALAVAGLGILGAGGGPAGWLLAGCGIAAKPVTAPLVLAWAVMFPPARGRRLAAALLVAAPSVAWLAKTWVATGNPVFPLLWRVFPSPFWGARNEASNLAYHLPLCMPDALGVFTFPRGVLKALWGGSPLLLAAVLFVLARRGSWRAGWVGVLGLVLTLALGRMPRFLLAAEWWLAWVAARELCPPAPGWRRWSVSAVAAAAAARFAFAAGIPAVEWRVFRAPAADVEREELGTWGEAASMLRAAGVSRMVSFGELRVLGLPGRVVSAGGIGETPLAWEIAGASRDPADVRKKFRQLGVRIVLHDFVSDAYRAPAYAPFAWDDRRLVVYRGFVRWYLRPAFVPSRVDHVQGGFYVWRILDYPEAGPRLVYFLPGGRGLLAPAEVLQQSGRGEEAAREVARLGRLLRDVGHVRNVMAYSFRGAGNWDGAYRMYVPGIRAGMVDDENWIGFAHAAAKLGRRDEALVAARRAWELYPGRRMEADQLLATLQHEAGEAALSAGKPAAAEAAYRDCLERLGRLPGTTEYVDARVFALVRLADALARQGKRREAQEKLDEAGLARNDVYRTPEAQAVMRRIGNRP